MFLGMNFWQQSFANGDCPLVIADCDEVHNRRRQLDPGLDFTGDLTGVIKLQNCRACQSIRVVGEAPHQDLIVLSRDAVDVNRVISRQGHESD